MRFQKIVLMTLAQRVIKRVLFFRYVQGKTLPRPPAPNGGNDYQPSKDPKKCNPCNQVPWIPLYHGVSTSDSRYAASSDVVKSPVFVDTSAKQQNSAVPNTYQAPSHEVKIPDFGYGPPAAAISGAFEPNHQASSNSAQLSYNNNNPNLNIPQPEYDSPFTGPIPNPHLYPGAMPPLFKAKPWDLQPQGSDTSFDPPQSNAQSNNQQATSMGAGNSEGGLRHSFEVSPSQLYNPSSNLGSPLLGSQDSYNQPQYQNPGFSQPGGTTAEGYVDELPPGAETASGPEDNFPPLEGLPDANVAANSNFRHEPHESTDHEQTSGTSSVAFGPGQSEPISSSGTEQTSGNSNQATSYGSQVSSDGQHVLHFEQSPVIDLSGDETIDNKRKEANDSSAASSISTDAIEEPPVILQNADGTYGINATWAGEDSSKISWPENDESSSNVAAITTLAPGIEFSSESGQSVRFEDITISPSNDDVSTIPSALDNRPSLTGHLNLESGLGFQGQGFQKLEADVQLTESSKDSSQESSEEQNGSRQAEGIYSGLLKFMDIGRLGFRPPDPPITTTEEPFMDALMKSYENFKAAERQNQDQSRLGSETGKVLFDPRQIHAGVGFQPSNGEPANSGDGNLRPTNRQQGKRNKQVRNFLKINYND